MSRGAILETETIRSILEWAVQRQAGITVSVESDGQWCNLRSHLVRFDPDADVLKIVYPISLDSSHAPEIPVGTELGVSLRRSHKKCIFVSPVILRCCDPQPDGESLDVLVIRAPRQIRELQRRVYQRVVVPTDQFTAVKLWQGGLPSRDEPSWPICSGRLANISVGGLRVDVSAERNPRLGVGEIVGVEITDVANHDTLVAEAQYRHCTMVGSDRLGLGLQFLGLEHELPGRTSIVRIAEFVKRLRASVAQSH